jgi:hypothetical protein
MIKDLRVAPLQTQELRSPVRDLGRREVVMIRYCRLCGGMKYLAAAAVIISMACLSCNEDRCSCPDNGDGSPMRGTGDGLISFLALVYEDRDLDHYEEALHDGYTFEFVPEVAESLSLPAEAPWWGKVEDMTSTGNMFEDATVTHIDVDMVRLLPWTACTDEVTGLAGMCTTVEPDIKVMMEEPMAEPVIFWVNYSRLNITIVPDQYYPELWQILRIKEYKKYPGGSTATGLATEQSTWSSIKAYFR